VDNWEMVHQGDYLLRLPDTYFTRRTRKKVDGLPEVRITLALFSIIATL
jgi:hypothetical protein